MSKKITLFLILNLIFQGLTYSQNQEKNLNNSFIERFQHKDYESFTYFIITQQNFPTDAMDNNIEGVFLAGLAIEANGDLANVFPVNSLCPSIDTSVLELLKSSKGHWLPKLNNNSNQRDTVIIPFVFCLGESEYKINRENFKLTTLDEVVIRIRLSYSTSKVSTEKLLSQYYKKYHKKKFSRAYKLMLKLNKRDPLNVDYFNELTKLEMLLGHNEKACQNLKFIKANFIKQPDLSWSSDLGCPR